MQRQTERQKDIQQVKASVDDTFMIHRQIARNMVKMIDRQIDNK